MCVKSTYRLLILLTLSLSPCFSLASAKIKILCSVEDAKAGYEIKLEASYISSDDVYDTDDGVRVSSYFVRVDENENVVAGFPSYEIEGGARLTMSPAEGIVKPKRVFHFDGLFFISEKYSKGYVFSSLKGDKASEASVSINTNDENSVSAKSDRFRFSHPNLSDFPNKVLEFEGVDCRYLKFGTETQKPLPEFDELLKKGSVEVERLKLSNSTD